MMMVQAAFPEEFDETEQAREENLDEWMDVTEQQEMDEGDVTPSEIMPGDLELAEETLDDDLMNEYGMHVEVKPPDEE
jgi:hypothetical protein